MLPTKIPRMGGPSSGSRKGWIRRSAEHRSGTLAPDSIVRKYGTCGVRRKKTAPEGVKLRGGRKVTVLELPPARAASAMEVILPPASPVAIWPRPAGPKKARPTVGHHRAGSLAGLVRRAVLSGGHRAPTLPPDFALRKSETDWRQKACATVRRQYAMTSKTGLSKTMTGAARQRDRYAQYSGQKATLTLVGSTVTGLVCSVNENGSGTLKRWIVTVVAK